MKTVLVTGGARGIGAEITKIFARNGYTVLLNYFKSEDQAKALQQILRDENCDVHLFQCDVTKEDQVKEMFERISKLFHRLDVLVNNAGVALHKQVQETSTQQYDFVMDVNCRGTFYCCKYAVNIFLNQDFGNIVNMSSIWGIKGASCESVYAMSKHAIVGLTLSLHEELYSSGVCVNCVCPGIVATDMCKHLTDEDIKLFSATYGAKVVFPDKVAQKIFEIVAEQDSGKIVEV